MAELSTIIDFVRRNCSDATYSGQPAIREKSLGIWETFDWKAFAENVESFAMGLASLGFARDDKLSVLGNNRPKLYWAQLSAMALGGQSVPVYHDSIATELTFVLTHAETKIIVAEDQEQVDKILSIRADLPNLQWLVYCDPRGLTDYDEDILLRYEDVVEKGRAFAGQNAGHYQESVSSLTASDIALIAYTSGTTGQPKGVMLSHANIIKTSEIFIQNEDLRADDDFLAYLPLAWVGDSVYNLCVSVMVGCATNCPESPETLMHDLRELGPTGILAPPRVWDGMISSLQVRAADAGGVKRWVYQTFRDVAEAVELARQEGRPVSGGLKLKHAIGEWLLYGPVRDQLGLRRARWCLTGGAPLGPDAFRFFRGFGINLKQVYGATEVSGLVSLQPDDQANPDTVGLACNGIDLKVDEDTSEVMVRSPGVFVGYYKEVEKTAEVLQDDGWFHTGDAGLVDDRGHLVIIDRAKDVGKMADGSAFAPQFVELKLKFSPYIGEAVAFGDGRPFVSAMVAIDFDVVGNWADKANLPYTNYVDLSQKPEVRQLVAEEIRRINNSLPESTRIKRFLLLNKDFDADDDEVTRTRKIRRAFVTEKYAPVVNALYGGDREVDMKIDVTFEDGTKSQIDSHLIVEDAA